MAGSSSHHNHNKNYSKMNGHMQNGYAQHNGYGPSSSPHDNRVVTKEMCFFCFEVLNNKLNNYSTHINVNFTNDS